MQIISNNRNTRIPEITRIICQRSRDLLFDVGTEGGVVASLLSLTLRLVIGKSSTPVVLASISVFSTVLSLSCTLCLINTTKSTPTLPFQRRRTFTDIKFSSILNTLVSSLVT